MDTEKGSGVTAEGVASHSEVSGVVRSSPPNVTTEYASVSIPVGAPEALRRTMGSVTQYELDYKGMRSSDILG